MLNVKAYRQTIEEMLEDGRIDTELYDTLDHYLSMLSRTKNKLEENITLIKTLTKENEKIPEQIKDYETRFLEKVAELTKS